MTAPSASFTYGGTLPALAAPTYSGFVEGDTVASLSTPATCTTTATSTSPAGTYPVTCSGATDVNYAITYVDGAVTINPASGLTVTAPASTSITYGSALPAFAPTYSGFVNGDTAASLSTPATCTTTATSSSPAGSYPVTCSGAVDANYTTATYTAGTLTIKPAALSVSGPSASFTYGGTLPSLTPSYSGFANGDTAASLSTPATCTTTATSNSPAGSYPVTCTGATDPNYTITYATGSLTIKPAALSVSGPSASFTYGGTLPALAAPTYAGFVNGDTTASLSKPATCATTATSSSPAGSYPVTCTGAVDPNYTITYTAGSVTIKPAALTVTAPSPSSTYGGALPALTATYSGFVNGDTAASLSKPATCTTTATSSSPAGSYPSPAPAQSTPTTPSRTPRAA